MFLLTIYIAKLTNFISSNFKIGSGFTWPGHIALKLYPNILKNKRIHFPKGVILISGTNGKTTTSKLVTHILESSDLKVTHNKTGANLLNGIVSSILLNASIFGKVNSDVGVFEVDENVLPQIVESLTPNVLVLLNLSRDQLDRYGEVDIILDKWISSIKKLSSDTEIVLDKTQKYFETIPEKFKGEVTYFDSDETYLNKTNLIGSFNAKNVNAAVFTSMLVGIDEVDIDLSLESFKYAYGRGELIEHNDQMFKVLLAKNPASFDNNLNAIKKDIESDVLLFILNDNIPDGRDVSWIYDINTKELAEVCEGKKIFVAGTRYLDMAIRLQYAGVEEFELITPNLKEVLHEISLLEEKEVIILPNYSAMLEIRKLLTGKGIL